MAEYDELDVGEAEIVEIEDSKERMEYEKQEISAWTKMLFRVCNRLPKGVCSENELLRVSCTLKLLNQHICNYGMTVFELKKKYLNDTDFSERTKRYSIIHMVNVDYIEKANEGNRIRAEVDSFSKCTTVFLKVLESEVADIYLRTIITDIRKQIAEETLGNKKAQD